MRYGESRDPLPHGAGDTIAEVNHLMDVMRRDPGAPRPNYDPFAAGEYQVDVSTLRVHDSSRDHTFPVAVWTPRGPQAPSLVAYSHHSGGHREVATFLCTHLASHGYAVAAMDHSEVVAQDLPEDRAERIATVVAGRVPDLRFLLDQFGRDEVGLVGHSFGGWAVLATAEVDPRVRSVVAMGPGGATHPRPGILELTLTMERRRDVPVLFLAAAEDVPIPLENVRDVYERTPQPKRLLVLPQADHQHFIDDVEGAHEAARRATLPGDAAWIPGAMRPIAELMSGEEAHRWVRGVTLAHLDATLRGVEAAVRLLDGMEAGGG